MWDSSDNTWSSSDIKSTLNTTFLNTLSITWQNKIASHVFKVGGGSDSYLQNEIPRTVYNYEVGSNSINITDSMKIGLMYVSDYGFAVSNNYWTINLISYNSVTENNWMYLGSNEWTISGDCDTSNGAFFVTSTGSVFNFSGVNFTYAVRPVFYLNSNVQYASGSGTQSDPIRLVV